MTAIWDVRNASCTVTEVGRSFKTVSMNALTLLTKMSSNDSRKNEVNFMEVVILLKLLVFHYAAKRPLECPHRSDSVQQCASLTTYFGVHVCRNRFTPLLLYIIPYSSLFRLSFLLSWLDESAEWPAGGRFSVHWRFK